VQVRPVLSHRCGSAVESVQHSARHVERREQRGDECQAPEHEPDRLRMPAHDAPRVRISSFEKKPESGGTPAIASVAIHIKAVVHACSARARPCCACPGVFMRMRVMVGAMQREDHAGPSQGTAAP